MARDAPPVVTLLPSHFQRCPLPSWTLSRFRFTGVMHVHVLFSFFFLTEKRTCTLSIYKGICVFNGLCCVNSVTIIFSVFIVIPLVRSFFPLSLPLVFIPSFSSFFLVAYNLWGGRWR